MNTENSNFYLKHGKLIGLTGLISALLVVLSIYVNFIQEQGSNLLEHPKTSILLKTVSFLFSLVFWGTIGTILNTYRNSLICLLLTVFVEIFNYYFLNDQTNSIWGIMITVVPYFIFGLLEFKNIKSGIIMLLIGLSNYILYTNINISTLLFESIGQFYNISDFFKIEFRKPSDTMGASYTSTFIPISNIISSFASYCFHIILFCELYRYCQNGFQKIKVNILNFQNEYSKLTMTVLFFSLKWMILRIGISIPEFFSPRSIYKYSGFELSLSFQYTQLTCSILTFVFCIYFLRKILVEFFISYGRPPSWLYWLCLIPIFDYIIWLVVIFSFEKKNNQTERLNLFETENDNLSLVIFMIIIQLFSMYRGLVDNEFSESFFKFFICLGVVNAILTILAYKNIAPLKFIFWLMVLSAIISLGFVIKPLNGVYSEATLIMLAFSLFSIAVIVHFFPIFHLQEFLYIGGEDEEIAKENIE